MTWLPRFTYIELRKSVDTKSALVLLAVIFVLAAGFAVLASTGEPDLNSFVGSALIPLPFLLPVISALSATSEWSQRATVTTFSLVPRRSRILVARLMATVLLVLLLASAIVVTTMAIFVVMHPAAFQATDWAEFAKTLWSILVLAITAALTGVAMGYLLLIPALAISVTLLVPVAYDVFISLRFPDVGPWISSLAFSQWLMKPNLTWESSGLDTIGLGPALSSLLLWTVLPLAAGWVRQLRKEVK